MRRFPLFSGSDELLVLTPVLPVATPPTPVAVPTRGAPAACALSAEAPAPPAVTAAREETTSAAPPPSSPTTTAFPASWGSLLIAHTAGPAGCPPTPPSLDVSRARSHSLSGGNRYPVGRGIQHQAQSCMNGANGRYDTRPVTQARCAVGLSSQWRGTHASITSVLPRAHLILKFAVEQVNYHKL